MKFYKIFLVMFLQSIKLKDTTIWCGLKKAHSINFGKFKFCVIRFSVFVIRHDYLGGFFLCIGGVFCQNILKNNN